MQIKERKRVEKYGEVFTSIREVSEIIDMVEHEASRIESKFFEPTCGNGNFLAEVLAKKIKTIEKKYIRNQIDYERSLIIATGSLYGIDILKDNVIECRARLEKICHNAYTKQYKQKSKQKFKIAIEYILSKNILWGDALTLKSVKNKKPPLVFSEWAPINESYIKRRDYTLSSLLDNSEMNKVVSDEGSSYFMSVPIKEFKKTHYLDIPLNEYC